MINLLFMIEMIGTVAFACSGAMVAIQKDLDLLGILVLGVTTACGGGMIRDLLIGSTPPTLFIHPVYVAVAAASTLILFLFVRFLHSSRNSLQSALYDSALSLMDSVGLGAFTVVGINTAISAAVFLNRRSCFAFFIGLLTSLV